MPAPELAQLKMLAQVDDLLEKLRVWSEPDSVWQPYTECRSLVRRLQSRVETLRIRLESPLIVATFGGTGTGKSALVNALVGQECTTSGRQRPTTRQPILIAHPDTELDQLGVPLDQFQIQSINATVLRDIVIIDCPDPDTSEGDAAGTNTAMLRQLIPHCDVLIYTSTQQKYRNARVVEELGESSDGCRLLFVQTHADIDSDIREDWRKHLEKHYEVPDLFFVDSVRAFKEQADGQRPSGDFGRLQDMLTSKLAASTRLQVRRANLIDLVHSALQDCQEKVDANYPQIETLRETLQEQRQKLKGTLSDQLRDELLLNSNLWERRLIGSVTDIWGFSPFSAVLRFYNGIGSVIASFTLFRARSTAQIALIGAVHGARWFSSRSKEREAEDKLERVSHFGLDDSQLQECRIIVDGYVRDASLNPALVDKSSLDSLRENAARVEGQFLGDARRKIDEIIDDLAVRHSGSFTRIWYEILLLAYVAFLLFRIGKNFFWDTFLRPLWAKAKDEQVELLTIDFYVPAAIFFILWTGILVMLYTRRLRRGLSEEVEVLATDMAASKISLGLFPDLELRCQQIESDRKTLKSMAQSTQEIRHEIAHSTGELGGKL